MFSLSRLFPREEKFYKIIEQMAGLAGMSARHLKSYIEAQTDADRASAIASIRMAKNDAKSLSSYMTKQLCITFVTPFDREDIQDFTLDLYKIPKTIHKVCEYLELHLLNQFQDLLPQVELIIKEADAMESMVQALIQGDKSEQIIKQAALLDELENQGDAILSDLLVNLMKTSEDARQMILRKDIYDLLERVIDKYRNAAEIALKIVLKHS